MATNELYAKAKERMLNGSVSWQDDTIVASLVNGSYVVDFGSHQYLSDLGTNLQGFPQTVLTGKTSTNGVADADDVVWSAGSFIQAGSFAGTYSNVGEEQVAGVVIYQGLNGSVATAGTVFDAASPLIAYYGTLVSFPFVWNGQSNVRMTWSNGDARIFAL